MRAEGKKISYVHLRYLNPFPANLGDILKRFKQVAVPELNSGHLKTILQSEYLVPVVGLNKVQGLPLKAFEVEESINALLEGRPVTTFEITADATFLYQESAG
jgi:2-oxoglutarate ferredoxin oxidoreductase subunit alpha